MPMNQLKTRLGVAGASHPKIKTKKDRVPFSFHFALDWTKRFGELVATQWESDQMP